MKKLNDVQKKYDFFLMIYEQGVKVYVLFRKVKGTARIFQCN